MTTSWDDVQKKDRDTMEKHKKELMGAPGLFFELLIAAGGQFHCHNYTTGSAQSIVEEVFKIHPIPLQTQLRCMMKRLLRKLQLALKSQQR